MNLLEQPEWAKYKAMDEDGEWYWYDEKPFINITTWTPTGHSCCPASDNDSWKESLQEVSDELV